MRSGSGCIESSDELIYQQDIGVVYGMRVIMTIKCSEVDDHIASADKLIQFILVIEVIILERYPCNIVLSEPEKVIKMGSNESGLAGDADI